MQKKSDNGFQARRSIDSGSISEDKKIRAETHSIYVDMILKIIGLVAVGGIVAYALFKGIFSIKELIPALLGSQ